MSCSKRMIDGSQAFACSEVTMLRRQLHASVLLRRARSTRAFSPAQMTGHWRCGMSLPCSAASEDMSVCGRSRKV